jgi:4-amino-4-deoxy-L-arabinose transferase-like glycosyltransferase
MASPERWPVLKVGSATHRRLLVVILLAAVLLRVTVALYMGDQVTVLPGIQDQVSYEALAQSLLAGRGYSFTENWYPFTPANAPTAHWSFLYPLYLAATYAVFGLHPLAARLVQAILGGALISLLVYLIGRRVANEETGLVAAGLAAVYGYFVYYSAALMTETFFIVSVLWSLYLALELKEKPALGRWVLLGAVLGVAALLRQTILIFAPFLMLWLYWELRSQSVRWWCFFVPAGMVALLIVPWTVRNYVVYQQILPLNSNAGYALYASNNPTMGTNWSNDRVVVPVPEELKGQNEAELNQSLTRKGIEYVVSDPRRYLWLTVNKTEEYFRFWPTSESSAISNLNRVLSFGLYLPFMLLGLALSVRRWHGMALLYLFIVIHTAIHLLSWPSVRYRLPVDGVLMVFAAVALIACYRQITMWRRKIRPLFRLASEPRSSGQLRRS